MDTLTWAIQNRLLGWRTLAQEWDHKIEHYPTTRLHFNWQGKPREIHSVQVIFHLRGNRS